MSMVKSWNPDGYGTGASLAERNKIGYYNENEGAWDYASGFNTFDVTQGGWVNHLLRCKLLEATNNFYDTSGNIAEINDGTFRCEVMVGASGETVKRITMRKKGKFVVNSFSCNFSFGESDLVYGTVRSHAAAQWNLELYLKGSARTSILGFARGERIFQPDDYSERTVYDVPYQYTFSSGVECDDIRVVCQIGTYGEQGVARTWVSNIKINGEDFTGNALIIS